MTDIPEDMLDTYHESQGQQPSFNEAPASSNTNIRTQEGFVWQVTLRAINGQEMKQKIEGFQKVCELKGWVPEVKSFGFPKREKDYVQGRNCPTCQGRLINAKKKDGTPYVKCENGKWDPATRAPIGCQYVEWPNRQQSSQQPSQDYF